MEIHLTEVASISLDYYSNYNNIEILKKKLEGNSCDEAITHILNSSVARFHFEFLLFYEFHSCGLML